MPWAALLLLAPLQGSPESWFEEITAEAGLSEAPAGRPSFGDYDGDGDPDLLIGGTHLYRNDTDAGAIRFVDVTVECGLGPGGGGGASWLDFDRDGRLDFATNNGRIWLQEEPGKFTDRGNQLGLEIPAGKATAIGFGDLDGDGWLDLFTGGAENWEEGQYYPQTIWRNDAGKRLVNCSEQLGIGAQEYGRAVIWCDYDWDGDTDLYLGHYRLKANRLYRNDAGTLTDLSEATETTGVYDQDMYTIPTTGERCGYHYGHTIAASWADLNNDGWFDLWVSNLVHKAVGEVSEEFAKVLGMNYDYRGFICDDSNLFLNPGARGGEWTSAREELGIPIVPIEEYGKWRGDELWSNAACADFNNDGWIDVFVNQVYVNQANSFAYLFRNSPSGFSERHSEAGVQLWGGYGSAWADLDSDGRLDLLVEGATEVKGAIKLHLFQNRMTEVGSWIGFRLVADRNQSCGAKLLLHLDDGGVLVRQTETSMGSHTQQNEGRLHFGLGDAQVDRAFLYWPDGAVQILEGPEPDRYHTIERGKGPVPRVQSLSPLAAKAGEPTTFVFKGGRGREYLWDFTGDRAPETTTQEQSATWTFANAGTYTLRMLVIGKRGFGAEGSWTIEVTE